MQDTSLKITRWIEQAPDDTASAPDATADDPTDATSGDGGTPEPAAPLQEPAAPAPVARREGVALETQYIVDCVSIGTQTDCSTALDASDAAEYPNLHCLVIPRTAFSKKVAGGGTQRCSVGGNQNYCCRANQNPAGGCSWSFGSYPAQCVEGFCRKATLANDFLRCKEANAQTVHVVKSTSLG